MQIGNQEITALGLDLSYRSIGLALVTSKEKVRTLETIQIPRLPPLETHKYILRAYQVHHWILSEADIIFVETPSTGMLGRLFAQKQTSIKAIQAQALSRLGLEIALKTHCDPRPKIYDLDPAKIAQSYRNMPALANTQLLLKGLKLEGAKLTRRLWLYHCCPSVDWTDPRISEHASDAAHLALVAIRAYVMGRIESLQ